MTDAVLDEVASWQQRPLDQVYQLILFDAIRVKIRDEGIVRINHRVGHGPILAG